jgi:ketosteroid isomerase-like protein
MSAALETARAFEAAWQAGDFATARTYLADDLVYDDPFGRFTGPEVVIGKYMGIAQVVAGPARETAAFGDDTTAVIFAELPTTVFGTSVNANRYVVRDGKIAEHTLVYDATGAKAQQPPQG